MVCGADVFDPSAISVLHCMQRCVRQAYLCGDDLLTSKNFDHRKQWLEDRLRQLAAGFGIDVLAKTLSSTGQGGK